MVSQALEAVTPTLRDVAGWCAVNYGTLRSYKAGERTAPPDVVRRLVVALRQQAATLEKLADRLEAQAERDP